MRKRKAKGAPGREPVGRRGVSGNPADTASDWSIPARLLRAELAGDEQEWRRLLELNRQSGEEFGVMPVAFAMVLERWFTRVGDRREITRLVARYNEMAPPAYRLPSREAEAFLRANLGEEYLAELVDDRTAVRTIYSLLFMLVDELALSAEEIDGLVGAADALARSILESGAPSRGPQIDLQMMFPGDQMQWRPEHGGRR